MACRLHTLTYNPTVLTEAQLKQRVSIWMCLASALTSGVLVSGQSSGVFFVEDWNANTVTNSFNSSFYGSLSGSQFSLQTDVASTGYALRHRLLAGTTPGSVSYATQHFGDSIAGPAWSSGRGQHFLDYYIQYKVYYSPGFDFHTNYKQFIVGTQDDRRHEEACCNPWVAHYLTIYAGTGGALLAEANNKQAASGQWVGLGANQSGYNNTNRFILQSGRWYTIEVRRRLNDANVDNGIYQMWVNGLLITDRRDIRFRVPWNGSFGSNLTYGTNFAMISDYPLQNVSREQSIYYDDVKFSSSPIGFSDSTAPAAPTNLRVIR